jgi:hypothetical protein
MKKNKLFWMMAMLAMALMVAMPSCSSNNGDDPYEPEEPPIVIPGDVHESLQGTDYHLIFLDAISFSQLGGEEVGTRVTQDLRPNDVDRFFQIWPDGTSYSTNTATSGLNAMGQPEGWMPLIVGTIGWSGAGFLIQTGDIRGIDASYTFHMAIKSPTNQQQAGHLLTFVSDNLNVELYFGPEGHELNNAARFYSNYEHNGEWQHFDIPVSYLIERGWVWTTPLTRVNDDGTIGANVVTWLSNGNPTGTELNFDALFFYKKKAE